VVPGNLATSSKTTTTTTTKPTNKKDVKTAFTEELVLFLETYHV